MSKISHLRVYHKSDFGHKHFGKNDTHVTLTCVWSSLVYDLYMICIDKFWIKFNSFNSIAWNRCPTIDLYYPQPQLYNYRSLIIDQSMSKHSMSKHCQYIKSFLNIIKCMYKLLATFKLDSSEVRSCRRDMVQVISVWWHPQMYGDIQVYGDIQENCRKCCC